MADQSECRVKRNNEIRLEQEDNVLNALCGSDLRTYSDLDCIDHVFCLWSKCCRSEVRLRADCTLFPVRGRHLLLCEQFDATAAAYGKII